MGGWCGPRTSPLTGFACRSGEAERLQQGLRTPAVRFLALLQPLSVISGKTLNVPCLPVPASCPVSQLVRLYKPSGKKCLSTCFCRD